MTWDDDIYMTSFFQHSSIICNFACNDAPVGICYKNSKSLYPITCYQDLRMLIAFILFYQKKFSKNQLKISKYQDESVLVIYIVINVGKYNSDIDWNDISFDEKKPYYSPFVPIPLIEMYSNTDYYLNKIGDWINYLTE